MAPKGLHRATETRGADGRRAMMVLGLPDHVYSVTEVGRASAVIPKTVYNWRWHFQTKRLAG